MSPVLLSSSSNDLNDHEVPVSVSRNGVKVAATLDTTTVINLNQGDPTLFESYWRKTGNKCTVTIRGDQSLSYFSNFGNLCWFIEPELEQAIKKLHCVVGNAVVEDRHIIVGTGSSQLIQAALYALTTISNQPKPVDVICALPYYSCYPEVTSYLRSGLYKWGGDASVYDKDEPYIELVTTPNNPDGTTRKPVAVNHGQGKLIYDFAYMWPQFAPITAPADHDIMLFTASKCTGHAGSRTGWAIVRDKEVAQKMVKYIEVNTVGVSRDAQLRTAKIIGAVSDSCTEAAAESESFFKFGQLVMARRWKQLREIIDRKKFLSVPVYPREYCLFSGEHRETLPAFAWITCSEEIGDAASFFRRFNISTRGGESFGVEANSVRLSMVGNESDFNLFLERLSAISI